MDEGLLWNPSEGVPQGSNLLFFLYIDNICDQLKFTSYLMYGDDTILYSSAASLKEVYTNLQSHFVTLQIALHDAKLVLCFPISLSEAPNIKTLKGDTIEVADSY